MVVVGNSGKCSASSCSFWRVAKVLLRLLSCSVIAFTRAFTSGLWIRVEVLRFWAAFLFSSKIAFTSGLRSWPKASALRVAISFTFCLAKASHCLISGVSTFSLFSSSKLQGECNKEEEEAMYMRSLLITSFTFSMRARECSKLFFQMLRPSTIPKESFLSLGSAFSTLSS